jgi:hypothetical protein
MVRTFFSVTLILLIVASAIAPAKLPAWATTAATFNESGLIKPDAAYVGPAYGPDTVSVDGFTVDRNSIRSNFGFLDLGHLQYNGNPARTLLYGQLDPGLAAQGAHIVELGGSTERGSPFLGLAINPPTSSVPTTAGPMRMPDMPLHFDSYVSDQGRLSAASIVGSDIASSSYNVTGRGVKIAIVDTGTDFSNPDVRHSVARDAAGVPIMLDADGQGIVLTKAKFIAKIDNATGNILNYTDGATSDTNLPAGITSYVYVNSTGVYLKAAGVQIPVYNTLYPYFATPVINATVNVDWKIGNSPSDYIHSKSGIYRFGVEFQTQLYLGTTTFALVPFLVVDSTHAGVYDTIIPDMADAWNSFSSTQLRQLTSTNFKAKTSYDFTQDHPIRLGDGKEFLVYDYDGDGFPDFSAGTVGARVLDIWNVIGNSAKKYDNSVLGSSSYAGVVRANLLQPLDPNGDYFGIMYDFEGHGTSTAATITSKGINQYSIYGKDSQYRLNGIAPDAKIIPVKALWAGNALFGWLYASGFDLGSDGKWHYGSGDYHRADIISNSWGITNLPLVGYGQGYDLLSTFASLLSVPGLLADKYPGIIMVNSAGNNGVGYGTVGSPNVSPLTITVGATTNNVFVGYDGFRNLTRFGNSTSAFDDIADFSSRGPGLFGDPKPELMATGAYAFTPTIPTIKDLHATDTDSNKDGAFALFGGTSMAAPITAGVAALVIEQMHHMSRTVDPFAVKSILMSSAKDIKSDPFEQGSGRVDAASALSLLSGKQGRFVAYTNDTVPNILSLMSRTVNTYNKTLGIIDFGTSAPSSSSTAAANTPHNLADAALWYNSKYQYSQFIESRWFGGQIEQGRSDSTEITVKNPSSDSLDVTLSSVIEKPLASYQIHNHTKLFETDPLHDSKTSGYMPNFFNLTKEIGGIPKDADMMVVKLNYPFSSFMNSSELYADGLRIASLYSYDWQDTNKDGNVSSDEISLVNRAGAWGTVQEMTVSDPAKRFQHTPLVGVYPVPGIFSFWRGDRNINSTSMNYTLTIEFYKRQPNQSIILQDRSSRGFSLSEHLPAGGQAQVNASILTTNETLPGIYYGSIVMSEKQGRQSTVFPVSYIVTTRPVPKDIPVVVTPQGSVPEDKLIMRPNGYVGGMFDMSSTYLAGDWRSYYFTVGDHSINSMSLSISWPHNSTSINAMVFAPDGSLVASSVPAGVFEKFAGWASNDWLGNTVFSQGGGFFFSQNSNGNATTLYAPINQTGVYSVLLHNTLFDGESLYEPVTLTAKFSTIIPDTARPSIVADVPKYIAGKKVIVPVTIMESDLQDYSYAIDANNPVKPEPSASPFEPPQTFDVALDGASLSEGMHQLQIDAVDTAGQTSRFATTFEVDKTPPKIDLSYGYGSQAQVPANRTVAADDNTITVSKDVSVMWTVTDADLELPVTVTMPDGKQESFDKPNSLVEFNSSSLADGSYDLTISAADLAGNTASRHVKVIVDNTPPVVSLAAPANTDVTGVIRLAIGATDANLARALLIVDGGKMSIDVTGLKQYDLDTSNLPDGKHDLKLVAFDSAGNSGYAGGTIYTANAKSIAASAQLTGILTGLGIGLAIAAVIGAILVSRRSMVYKR